ncbi:MAG TPA: molybdenum ABC transporter ATP-binding protein [Candidatus Sumerlaeota bacterium]|nr:molybdenum ABC transporter ATP-binding protein [Candidatus Sumerlaeota bacterium]
MKLAFDLTVRRPGFTLNARAEIDAGRTALFGPSGAGKTTLLLALVGLLRPDAGRIELDGETLFDAASNRWRPPERRGIGLVFQDDRLFPHMTVEENLLYGWRRLRPAQRRFAPQSIVELLELGGLRGHYPAALSGGEARRVALGRALLASPRLLLLDEPLTGLDLRLRRQILPFLRRIRDEAEIPIIQVSHDLEALLDLCEWFVLLDRGELVAQGRYLDLLARPEALRLLHEPGLLNVLRLAVVRHDPDAGLSFLRFPGSAGEGDVAGEGEIRAPFQDRPAGSLADLALRPQNIALARTAIAGISIQNQFAGRVERILESAGRVLCVVRIGAGVDPARALIVEVTRHAVHEMALKPADTVWCLFKAQSLRYL